MDLLFVSHMCFFFVALRPNAGNGLPILDVSRSHTTTHHSLQDSSGRVISSSQRPLPDNTRHSQQTNIHAPVGFEPTISAGKRPQIYALDGAATGTGKPYMYGLHITFLFNNVFPKDDTMGSKHVEGIMKQSQGLTDRVEHILTVSFLLFRIFFSSLSKHSLDIM